MSLAWIRSNCAHFCVVKSHQSLNLCEILVESIMQFFQRPWDMEHWEADAVLERSTGFVYDLTFEGNHFFHVHLVQWIRQAFWWFTGHDWTSTIGSLWKNAGEYPLMLNLKFASLKQEMYGDVYYTLPCGVRYQANRLLGVWKMMFST